MRQTHRCASYLARAPPSCDCCRCRCRHRHTATTHIAVPTVDRWAVRMARAPLGVAVARAPSPVSGWLGGQLINTAKVSHHLHHAHVRLEDLVGGWRGRGEGGRGGVLMTGDCPQHAVVLLATCCLGRRQHAPSRLVLQRLAHALGISSGVSPRLRLVWLRTLRLSTCDDFLTGEVGYGDSLLPKDDVRQQTETR